MYMCVYVRAYVSRSTYICMYVSLFNGYLNMFIYCYHHRHHGTHPQRRMELWHGSQSLWQWIWTRVRAARLAASKSP
jgi:hypothetical protein